MRAARGRKGGRGVGGQRESTGSLDMGQAGRLGTACNYKDNRLQARAAEQGGGETHLHPGSHTTTLSHGPAAHPKI